MLEQLDTTIRIQMRDVRGMERLGKKSILRGKDERAIPSVRCKGRGDLLDGGTPKEHGWVVEQQERLRNES